MIVLTLSTLFPFTCIPTELRWCGFPSVCCEHALLPLDNKEAALAYDKAYYKAYDKAYNQAEEI